ncbi:MAG: putative rane protein [Paenibacillus sp.]|jgi:hypothetical protein|nr:putative rane protein [Paenibacillus sp.]
MKQELLTDNRTPFSGYVFLVLAWGLVACIVIQTFIAGLAVFNGPSHWSNHRIFVHMFEFLPLIMLVFSFIGKLPQALRWQSAGLFILIFAQYFTANFAGAGAVHPVIATVLFWLSVIVARRAGTWCSSFNEAKNTERGGAK